MDKAVRVEMTSADLASYIETKLKPVVGFNSFCLESRIFNRATFIQVPKNAEVPLTQFLLKLFFIPGTSNLNGLPLANIYPHPLFS